MQDESKNTNFENVRVPR